jgi:hypothetical protein
MDRRGTVAQAASVMAAHVANDGKGCVMTPETMTHVSTQRAPTAGEPKPPALGLDRHGAAPQVTLEERRARGRALREQTPRSSHAFWAAAASTSLVPAATLPCRIMQQHAVHIEYFL